MATREQINTAAFTALAAYNGDDLNAKMGNYLASLGGTGASLNDLWASMMSAAAIPAGQQSDRQRRWLIVQGVTPATQLSDMFFDYWNGGPY